MKNFLKKNKSINKKIDNEKYIRVTFILMKLGSSKTIVIPLITTNIIKFIRFNLEIFLLLIYSIIVNITVVITKPMVATNILKNLYKMKKTAGGKISKTFNTLIFLNLI